MSGIFSTVADAIKAALEPPHDPPEPGDPPPLPKLIEDGADRLTGLFNLSGELSTAPADLEKWISKFKDLMGDADLRECIAIRMLQVHLPRVAEVLTLAGVITATWQPPEKAPQKFTIDWSALNSLTKDPGSFYLKQLTSEVTAIDDVKALQVLLLLLLGGPHELLQLEYDHQGFLALPVADHPGVNLDDLINLVNSPIAVEVPPPDPLTLDSLTTDTTIPAGKSGKLVFDGPDAPPPPASPLKDIGLRVIARETTAVRKTIPLPGSFALDVAFDASTGPLNSPIVALKFGDNGFDLSAPRPAAGLEVTLNKPPKDPKGDAFLFGEKAGTHFSVKSVAVGVKLGLPGDKSGLFTFVYRAQDVEFQVASDLLKTVAMGLPIPWTLTFLAPIERTIRQGVSTATDAAAGKPFSTQFTQHLGLAIGSSAAGLWVDDMLVRVEIMLAGNGVLFRTVFRFDARAALGPLKATMTGGGVWIGRWTGGTAGIVPPDGIGLSLAAGPVSGGGFLKNLGPGRYAGALQLKILGVGVFAYGLYDEIPGGVSFAALIGIRLPLPGIQIGFGFAVSGFGGLIAVNRRADLDALRDRLQSGSAGDVLFADNPMANAPKLLGDMAAMFPVERGVHVFGPTMQLNWCQLLMLDVGLFIELPGPRKIFVAGRARLIIGSEDFALVRIRVDFVGGVDLTASLIFFDGMLVDSSVLGIIKITGGVGLRIGFAGNSFFVYSVGGFHPDFNPGKLPVPVLPRAGASVSIGPLWLKQEAYLAVTSNTLQFGSKTEAGVKIGPIGVHGWFMFDALIQYRPFYFKATIDAGMEASFEDWSFASIRVQGSLTGPGALVLYATATVKIIFSISKDVTITIDTTPAEQLPPPPALADLLGPELSQVSNWRADGTDADVVFAGADDARDRLIPVGRLVWEQKRIPLDQLIDRAEGRDLPSPASASVTLTDPGLPALTPESDEFALGTFKRLTDAAALDAPTFVPARSGGALGSASQMNSGSAVPKDIELNLVTLPHRTRTPLSGVIFTPAAGLHAAITERISGASVAHESPVVGVRDEAYDVSGGGQPLAGVGAMQAWTTSLHSGGVVLPSSDAAVDLAGVL